MSEQSTTASDWLEVIAAGDWPTIVQTLRADGHVENVQELRNLWSLVGEFAPADQRQSLQRRIEAMARAAAKTAARLEKERQQNPDTTSTTSTAPAAPIAADEPPAADPSTTPHTEHPKPATSARPQPNRRFTLEADEELRQFIKTVNKERRARALPNVTDDQAAEALQLWHETLTVQENPLRFVSWPGYTGLCLAMWLAARNGKAVTPQAVPAGSRVWELARSRRKITTLAWLDTTDLPGLDTLVCELDINCQYLAAARSALLGDGEPIELDRAALADWDLLKLVKLPGYVILGSAPDLSGLPQHAQLAFAAAREGTVLPTPLAVYLVRDHKVPLDIAEAVVWHQREEHDERTGRTTLVNAYGKRLEPWAKVLEDGRAALADAARDQDDNHPAVLAGLVLKRTYSQFLGAILTSPKHNRDKNDQPTGWLRPDWRDQIIGTASANMLRALDKAVRAGWRVLGGLKDSAWLVAEDVDTSEHPHRPYRRSADGDWEPLSGMEVNDLPGRWKLTRWANEDELLLAVHATGRPQRFRKALSTADKTRRMLEQRPPRPAGSRRPAGHPTARHRHTQSESSA